MTKTPFWETPVARLRGVSVSKAPRNKSYRPADREKLIKWQRDRRTAQREIEADADRANNQFLVILLTLAACAYQTAQHEKAIARKRTKWVDQWANPSRQYVSRLLLRTGPVTPGLIEAKREQLKMQRVTRKLIATLKEKQNGSK